MSSVRQKMAAVHKAQNKQFEADKREALKPVVKEVEAVMPKVAPEVVEETTPAPEKPKTEKTEKTEKTAKTTKTAKTKKPASKGKKS